MARMIPGSIVSDLRGKIGGSVFQRSAGGLTIRAKTSPVNPRTASQAVTRNRLFSLQQAWQQLTATQRTAWDAWVIYQNIRMVGLHSGQLKGQAAFIQANTYRRLYSLADITNPVFTPHSIAITGVTVANVGGILRISYSGAPSSALYYPVLYSTPQQSAARNSPVVPPRLIAPAIFISGVAWAIGPPFQIVWGQIPATGSHLYITWGLTQVDNGTLSAFLSQPIEIT